MKKKILLLISLVLLAVQGWATPVDSLDTQSSGSDLTKNWNGVELTNGVVLPNGFNPNNLDFNNIEARSLGFVPMMGVIDILKDLYEVYTWCNENLDEFISFAFETKQFETIVGEYTDIYLIAFDARIHYPVTVVMTDETGAFEFCNETITPEEVLESSELNPTYSFQKRMRIRFRPTIAKEYTAYFKIKGSEKVEKDIALHCTAVGAPNDQSIYINPRRSFDFFTQTGSQSKPETFTVKANKELNLEIKEVNGTSGMLFASRMFSIDKKTISRDEALQGAEVTVTYKPYSVPFDTNNDGTHHAKIVITGEGLTPQEIFLFGYQQNGRIDVDLPYLSLDFPDKNVDGIPFIQDIHASGINLSGPMKVELYQDNPGMFLIQKIDSIRDYTNHKTLVTISVAYQPTEPGNHSAIITLSGNGTLDKPKIYLKGWTAEPTVTVTPSPLTFSTTTIGDYKTDELTIKGVNLTDNLNLTLTGATDVFSINNTVITPAQAASGQRIKVTYRPIAAGTQTAKVTISGGGMNETKTVNLTGNAVVREIKATPAALTISKITVGKSEPRSFTVTATNPNAPLILKLNDNTGMFSIKDNKTSITAEEAANGATITVIYKPTAVGSHIASISITGGGALEEKIVSLVGSAVPAAPTVTPSSLTFNDVVVGGDLKTDEFTVKGSDFTSNLNLTLTGATDVFSINNTVITPAQAASGQRIKVTYRPIAAGTQTAKVTISGGGMNETKTVNLTGTAIVRKITTDKSALIFSSQTVGKAVSKTFKITGTNLTGAVTVKLNDKTGMYSIDRTTAAVGATVTVTYKPTKASTSDVASITLYGGGAPEEKIVSLSGSAVVRKITTSDLNVTFYSTPVNQPVTKNFTVTGTNLTGSMTVKLTDASGMYSITPTTLPASGGTVKVTYKPTAKGSHTAKITISGRDALESVTVNLKGTAVVPSITVSPSSLSFTQGDASKSFKVTGSNLTGNLSLSLSGSSIFLLTKTSITASQAASGVSVSVGCIPKNATSASATITISGGGASSKTVTLSYRKSSGVVSINSVGPDSGDEAGNVDFTNGGSLDVMNGFTTDVNELAMNSKIYADGLNIIIESPIEQSAVISDISGRARSVNLQAGRNEIPVNASGIYIVRIREKTTKLMLK